MFSGSLELLMITRIKFNSLIQQLVTYVSKILEVMEDCEEKNCEQYFPILNGRSLTSSFSVIKTNSNRKGEVFLFLLCA